MSFFSADSLPDEGLAEVDVFVPNADAATVGDDDGLAVEGLADFQVSRRKAAERADKLWPDISSGELCRGTRCWRGSAKCEKDGEPGTRRYILPAKKTECKSRL